MAHRTLSGLTGVITGTHPRPLPAPALRRLRRWRLAGPLPALEAEPVNNAHDRVVRRRVADGADDLYGRCVAADVYGSFDEVSDGRLQYLMFDFACADVFFFSCSL